MSTLDEAFPNMVTVIKTEPVTEDDPLEDEVADDPFEQIFIKEEVPEDALEYHTMEAASGIPGLEETQGGSALPDAIPGCSVPPENEPGFHLNLHNELPLLESIKKEPVEEADSPVSIAEPTSSPATVLPVLEGIKKEPEEEANSPATIDVAEKMRTRFLQILRKQPIKPELVTKERRPGDPEYILPDGNTSEEERSSAKNTPSVPSGSTTNVSIASGVQVNQESGLKEYACDICKGVFPKLSVLERHKQNHTPNQALNHACRICGRLFSILRIMKKHEHIHKKQLSSCEDCGRKFICRSQLLRHQKMNSIDKRVKRYTKCQLVKWMRDSNSNEHFHQDFKDQS